MKVLVLLLITILAAQSHAEDLGDSNCNIVLLEANNNITGASGNYYKASVAVSKNFIAQYASNYGVILQYETYNSVKKVNYSEMIPTSKYIIYIFKLPFSAAVSSRYIKMIPFLFTDSKRIFDNNFGQGFVTLTRDNNWQFHQANCSINL